MVSYRKSTGRLKVVLFKLGLRTHPECSDVKIVEWFNKNTRDLNLWVHRVLKNVFDVGHPILSLNLVSSPKR